VRLKALLDPHPLRRKWVSRSMKGKGKEEKKKKERKEGERSNTRE